MSAAEPIDIEDIRRRSHALFGAPEPDIDEPAISSVPWPEVDDAALHGPVGDIVRTIDPTTEADRVAVATTFLTMFGSCVGRGPHLMVGDDRHGTNVYVVLVGDTAIARKGTSQSGPRRLMAGVDESWLVERVQGGVSTGEGLLWAIRDPVYGINKKTGEQELVDKGVQDKRLLLIEEELSFLLKTATRQGNTASEITRRAWDSRETLRIMTKATPVSASKPHVSFLAHITEHELIREISDVSLVNGFANRFAWFKVRRSKFLSNPVRMTPAQASPLVHRIAEARKFALTVGEMSRDSEASDMWDAVYPALSTGRPGLSGALTARAAPMVLRFALIYALLDSSKQIRAPHLEAALAIWEYADASVRSIFGDLTGDAVADRILAVIRSDGDQSRRDISDLFGRNVASARIGQALELLLADAKIESYKVEPDGLGRPATYYRAKKARGNV